MSEHWRCYDHTSSAAPDVHRKGKVENLRTTRHNRDRAKRNEKETRKEKNKLWLSTGAGRRVGDGLGGWWVVGVASVQRVRRLARGRFMLLLLLLLLLQQQQTRCLAA